MSQLTLFEPESVSFIFAIDYEGTGELQQNEIDANSYAISISGYAKFITELLTSLTGKNIEVHIKAHEEGSFKSFVKIACRNIFIGYSSIASILSFHGYNYNDIQNAVMLYSKKIISTVIEYNGKTNLMIMRIIEDKLLPEPVKEMIKKSLSNNKIRCGLDDFTSPLDRHGYKKITVSTNDGNFYVIQEAQRPAFKFTPPDIIEEKYFSETVSILYLSPELTEWKFQGKKEFWAEIKDNDFLTYTKNKLFSDLKGKKYAVSGIIKTIKKAGAKKGKSTYTIHKAIEVQHPHNL